MFCPEADDVPLPGRDDDDSNGEEFLDDNDTCTAFELEQYFSQKYGIQDEMAFSLKKEYILKLTRDDSFTRLAAGLSDTSVHIFNISSERGISQFLQLPPVPEAGKQLKVCGVRFVDESPNNLFVGTTNGIVRMFDLRSQKEEARFENDPENDGPKHILSLDRNCNSRLLSTGTEQFHSNVSVLFYDIRERKHMGGYFESHHDDVTSLQFHPENPDILATGSTDGLINVFDLKEANEEDALLTTVNTESSVQKVNWHKNVYNKDFLSCITDTNDFKVYEADGDLIADFERDKITESIKRKTPANCNLVDAHNTADGGVFLLTASNLHKGEIMRSLSFQNKILSPLANFVGNKQIVRESVFDANSNVLITAGEGSIVSLWRPQPSENAAAASKLKAKKSKSDKAKPY